MKDTWQITSAGQNIENSSFDIIDRDAGTHGFDPDQWEIVRRVIHTTGDFQFTELMRFHPEAVASGTQALRAGCAIVVDVKMIFAGLNQSRLSGFGCSAISYISDPDVIESAQQKNSTRAVEAMRKARYLGKLNGAVLAIGNAPTALLEIIRLIKEENVKPALVIGVPVGFVSAAESKEALLELEVPHIVARGTKGGSTIAVAIVHSLLILAGKGSIKI